MVANLALNRDLIFTVARDIIKQSNDQGLLVFTSDLLTKFIDKTMHNSTLTHLQLQTKQKTMSMSHLKRDDISKNFVMGQNTLRVNEKTSNSQPHLSTPAAQSMKTLKFKQLTKKWKDPPLQQEIKTKL